MENSNENETEIIKTERASLVVIDLEVGIVNIKGQPFTGEEVVQNATRLIKAFTEKGAFVVLVKISSVDRNDMLKPNTDFKKVNLELLPEGLDSFVPELINVENTHHITKRQWGAFYGTDLDLQLRHREIDTITLCGISTNIGVDTTAREAFQHGYNQIFASDAMTAHSKEEHDYVCKYIFPRIGKLRTTKEIVLSLK